MSFGEGFQRFNRMLLLGHFSFVILATGKFTCIVKQPGEPTSDWIDAFLPTNIDGKGGDPFQMIPKTVARVVLTAMLRFFTANLLAKRDLDGPEMVWRLVHDVILIVLCL